MAGASFDLDIQPDYSEIDREFKKLAEKMSNLRPFFNDIGEELLNSTRERFRSQAAPDGSGWAELSPAYKARKKKNQDLIGTLNGYLRGTLVKQADADSLRIGSPLIYAASFQFGRGNQPERPFLGLSDSDAEALLDALRDWLAR